MALIQCPECGKTFSNTVKKCPNCGYKIRKEKKKIEKGTKIKICSVLIAGILLIAIAITSFLVLTSPVRKIENLLNLDLKKELTCFLKLLRMLEIL